MLGEKDEEIGKEIDFQMYPNDKVSDALPLQNDFRNVTVYFRVGDPSNFWVVFVFLQKSSPPKKRINPWIAGFFCGFWIADFGNIFEGLFKNNLAHTAAFF